MHEVDLILTLTGGLTAALVLGYITQQLRLSPIVGYLLAGIAVGPHTPGFEADISIAQELAEIGVILLMFGVGLNFHIRELLAVRGVAIPGAMLAAGVATLRTSPTRSVKKRGGLRTWRDDNIGLGDHCFFIQNKAGVSLHGNA